MQPRDFVAVLAGSSVPHIVRPESGAMFRLFGELVWPPVELGRPAILKMPDGTRKPHIIRDGEGRHSLLGEAYVHKIINDEVWDAEGHFFSDLKIS